MCLYSYEHTIYAVMMNAQHIFILVDTIFYTFGRFKWAFWFRACMSKIFNNKFDTPTKYPQFNINWHLIWILNQSMEFVYYFIFFIWMHFFLHFFELFENLKKSFSTPSAIDLPFFIYEHTLSRNKLMFGHEINSIFLSFTKVENWI